MSSELSELDIFCRLFTSHLLAGMSHLRKLTSERGFRSNQPMCLKSGMALDASCKASVVSNAKAECKVLNQATASAESDARSTQLCTASGECSSKVLPSEIVFNYQHLSH